MYLHLQIDRMNKEADALTDNISPDIHPNDLRQLILEVLKNKERALLAIEELDKRRLRDS